MLAHEKKSSAVKKNAGLFLIDSEHLGFKDKCFDFVVTTFVLCSISELITALEEMKRVCKPEGTVINLEHMKSEKRLIAFFEDLFNPVSSAITGVNINRETVKNIKKARLNVTDVTNMALWDVFRMIKSKP